MFIIFWWRFWQICWVVVNETVCGSSRKQWSMLKCEMIQTQGSTRWLSVCTVCPFTGTIFNNVTPDCISSNCLLICQWGRVPHTCHIQVKKLVFLNQQFVCTRRSSPLSPYRGSTLTDTTDKRSSLKPKLGTELTVRPSLFYFSFFH